MSADSINRLHQHEFAGRCIQFMSLYFTHTGSREEVAYTLYSAARRVRLQCIGAGRSGHVGLPRALQDPIQKISIQMQADANKSQLRTPPSHAVGSNEIDSCRSCGVACACDDDDSHRTSGLKQRHGRATAWRIARQEINFACSAVLYPKWLGNVILSFRVSRLQTSRWKPGTH